MRTDAHEALVGRQDQIRLLEDLVSAVGAGRGGVLVLRGEPGIGKSALLGHVRQAAAGLRILEASGSEFEMELPFAILHQLCVPVLDHLAELPSRHREALEVAFGISTGTPDVFRVGLAALELLAAAARDRPLMCLVDDAHWLDDASAKALAFLARRVAAEPVAMVFAARHAPELDDLPGVQLEGLGDADARTLLATEIPVDERVRDRVLAEARGNPLALRELPKAGGFALPDTSSVTGRIERGYQARLAGLPAETRLLLTVASADPTGDAGLLWRAASRLGIDVTTAADADGLVEFGTRVRFCHPLARSAVYRTADAEQRRTAHGVLAEVTDPVADPDRRAWHRAQAAKGPDDDVAAELELSASRARARGGVAAAAAFLERAAELSLDPGLRVERTLAAVRAKLAAGATEAAAELLTTVPTGGLDDRENARIDLLRGQIAFVRHSDGDGPAFMLRAAQRLSKVNPRWSRVCFLDALEMALVVGRASGVIDMVAQAAQSAPPAPHPPDGADVWLDALVLLVREGHRAAVPMLRPIFASDMWTQRPALASILAAELWDSVAHASVTEWLMKEGRESGSPLMLRVGLAQVASAALLAGSLGRAMAAIAEEEAVADAMGVAPLAYPRLHLAAVRGRKKEAVALIGSVTAEATARGEGQLIANVHWATAVLNNGLGDYPAALAGARQAAAHGDLFLAGVALPELVEAAVRCGEQDAALSACESLTERTTASGTAWGLGVGAYVRALVTGDEEDYREAIEHLDESFAATYRARAYLLYGEWLRRQGRRRDARTNLRAAHEQLSAIGMEAFARRAADELRATGEQARSRSPHTYDQLTMQEVHIARLVATGATSKEVATRLFLSPRTVDAHLRNIFRKLGITSRRQLRDLPDFS